MCTHHHIYPGGTITNNVFVFLRQAPAHHNATPVLGVFPRLEMAQGAVELVVGIFANAAGVQHHNISVVIGLCARHAVGLQKPRNTFGVVFVHLAPKGAHNIRLWSGPAHGTKAI